jgi:hypothetical protein
MKIFNSIKEFIEYIPNCLVCGKNMILVVRGIRSGKGDWGNDRIHIKMAFDEGSIISTNKEHPLVITTEDNKLIVGEQLIRAMSNRPIGLDKSCRTCKFKIQTAHEHVEGVAGAFEFTINKSTYKTGIFPSVKLEQEELKYTKAHGKLVDIVRYRGQHTIVNVDYKRVNSFDLDISKFKDLDHLNNRLSVLMTFQ